MKPVNDDYGDSDLSETLSHERPTLHPAFRKELAREIDLGERWRISSRGARLLTLLCVAFGTLLSLIAVFSVAGVGPLAS